MAWCYFNRTISIKQNGSLSYNKITAALTLSQCQSRGIPLAIQCAWSLDPTVHWNATGEIIVGSQCVSSGLAMPFQWSSSVFQLCKLTLGCHWDTTGCLHQPVWFQWHPSVFVTPVVLSVFQLCNLTLDRQWDTTGCLYQPVLFQWHPSVLVAQVVFQCGLSSGIPMYWHNLVWRS